jgi:hypothetical protein
VGSLPDLDERFLVALGQAWWHGSLGKSATAWCDASRSRTRRNKPGIREPAVTHLSEGVA